MRKKLLLFFPIILLTIVILNSCQSKFSTEALNIGSGNANIAGDTVYIPLNPPWEGFNNPQAMIIGKEPFIYVADTDNNRVVMLNVDGQVLGSKTIKHPVALAQDYQLNLIVCAQYDTVVQGQSLTLSSVYKLDLVAAHHIIANAPVKIILPSRITDINNPNREYTGAAVFYDNSYLISRKGPNNSTVIDPDNSILSFKKKLLPNGEKKDTLIGRIPNLDPLGAGLPSANEISSISNVNDRSFDIIVTLTGNTSFKVQWLTYVDTREFTGFQNELSPDFAAMMTPNKFVQPEGSTVDNSGNIYIADAAKDSVYKFNSFGDEMQSFGGPNVFNKPYDVAYFDKTLYVVDSGNNRILRFVLSTDIR